MQKSVAKNDPFARLALQSSMRQRPRALIWRWSFAVCAIRQAMQKSEHVTRRATDVPSRAMVGGARLVEFSKSGWGASPCQRILAG
jgi:hypothetical protein